MKKISKPKPYYVPRSIQKLFVIGIASLYLIQSGLLLHGTLSQLYEGSDYRPQLGYFIVSNLVPLIVFGIAYILNPRQLSRLSRTFEALLISIAAQIGFNYLVILLPMLLFSMVNITDYVVIEYASAALFVLIYTIALLILRKKGTWS